MLWKAQKQPTVIHYNHDNKELSFSVAGVKEEFFLRRVTGRKSLTDNIFG